MNRPKITVIIPVYRTEAYLDRCIASVTAQTCKDLDILLIDDGSPDGSPQICDRWAEKDPRVRVNHKENQGLGLARNTGMDRAMGEYLCFLDSDDTLEDRALEKTLALAEKTGAELVLYGMTCIDAAGTVTDRRCPRTASLFEGDRVQKSLLPRLIAGEDGLTMSACCCLFSRELIGRTGWRFPSEREIISEDVYALLDLLSHVRRVAVLPEAPYRYYETPDSLSRRYRPDRFDKNAAFYEACLALCSRRGYGPETVRCCAVPFLSFTVAAMKQAVRSLGRDALPELRRISRSPVLARALAEAGGRHGWKRQLLLFFLKRRRTLAVYALLRAQNRIQ